VTLDETSLEGGGNRHRDQVSSKVPAALRLATPSKVDRGRRASTYQKEGYRAG